MHVHASLISFDILGDNDDVYSSIKCLITLKNANWLLVSSYSSIFSKINK